LAYFGPKLGSLRYGGFRYKKPQEPLWYWDLVVVARDGIEPPTRGFSVLLSDPVSGCVSACCRGMYFSVGIICAAEG